MLGYRLIEVKCRPAEAWAELKETANRLAEVLCEMVTDAARDAERISGQRVSRIVIRKGNFQIAAERNAPLTPTSVATWPRIHVTHTQERWGKSLPDRPPRNGTDDPLWTNWALQSKQVRDIVSALASIGAEDIQTAVDKALED